MTKCQKSNIICNFDSFLHAIQNLQIIILSIVANRLVYFNIDKMSKFRFWLVVVFRSKRHTSHIFVILMICCNSTYSTVAHFIFFCFGKLLIWGKPHIVFFNLVTHSALFLLYASVVFESWQKHRNWKNPVHFCKKLCRTCFLYIWL